MKLTRRSALAGLGAALLVGRPKATFAASPKSYDLTPKQVGDGVWMIEGSTEYFTDENGGAIVNCALLQTDEGILIIDTGPSLRYGTALRQVASQLTGRGIAGAVNTHHHPDHFFGNQVFSDRPIHALAQTTALAKSEGEAFSDNMYRLLGDWMRGTEVVPPTAPLESSVLTVGNRSLQVLPLAGHTGADLALLDQKTGTLIAGDLVFYNRAPTTPHADLERWRQSLDEIAALKPAAVLPGHGPLDHAGKAVQQTRDYLNWLETTLTDAANEGLDMVEIMETKLPQAYAAMGAMPQEFHRSVSHLFPTIERKVMPLVNR
ncbi:MAG: quinoprotein relay system zinc metallohydrolase 1 [Pseudomonadota bacterium]